MRDLCSSSWSVDKVSWDSTKSEEQKEAALPGTVELPFFTLQGAMMRYLLWMLSLLVLSIIIMVGCTLMPRPAADTIEVAEAKRVLDQAVAFTRAGGANALCGMGGAVPLCEGFLRDVGGIATAPRQAPRVTGSYIRPDTEQSIGGRVLVVEGVDSEGKPYRTEFFVLYDGGRLVPYLPVYWSGISMSNGDTTDPAPPRPR